MSDSEVQEKRGGRKPISEGGEGGKKKFPSRPTKSQQNIELNARRQRNDGESIPDEPELPLTFPGKAPEGSGGKIYKGEQRHSGETKFGRGHIGA